MANKCPTFHAILNQTWVPAAGEAGNVALIFIALMKMAGKVWVHVQMSHGKAPLAHFPSWVSDRSFPFPEKIHYSTLLFLDSGPNEFNYNANTTNCGDGTVCPNPGNQTCCSDHQGIRVIHFNNTDHLPEDPEGLAAYYSDGGYTISPSASASPTFVSFASRSPLTFPSSSPITFESSFPSSSETFAAQSSKNSPSAKSASSRPGPSDLPSLPKQSSPLSQPASTSYPALPLPTANSTQSATRSTLGSGAAAGIGVGVTVAALAIGMLLGLLLRSYQRRRKLHQAASPYAMPTDGGRRFEKPEMSADAARVEMDAGLLSRRQIHEINTESWTCRLKYGISSYSRWPKRSNQRSHWI